MADEKTGKGRSAVSPKSDEGVIRSLTRALLAWYGNLRAVRIELLALVLDAASGSMSIGRVGGGLRIKSASGTLRVGDVTGDVMRRPRAAIDPPAVRRRIAEGQDRQRRHRGRASCARAGPRSVRPRATFESASRAAPVSGSTWTPPPAGRPATSPATATCRPPASRPAWNCACAPPAATSTCTAPSAT